jgi:hypothetical protein
MMKRLSVLLLCACLVAGPVWAQSQTTRFFSAILNASEEITIDATAGGVRFTVAKVTSGTMPNIRRAQLATFRVACATTSPCPIRMVNDGSTVTTSHGFLLNEGDIVSIFNFQNIDAARFIRTGANSAILSVTYFD